MGHGFAPDVPPEWTNSSFNLTVCTSLLTIPDTNNLPDRIFTALTETEALIKDEAGGANRGSARGPSALPHQDRVGGNPLTCDLGGVIRIDGPASRVQPFSIR